MQGICNFIKSTQKGVVIAWDDTDSFTFFCDNKHRYEFNLLPKLLRGQLLNKHQRLKETMK